MYTNYLIAAIILLFFFILVQLIVFNLLVIKIKKSNELNKQITKEETDWEFVKGLY